MSSDPALLAALAQRTNADLRYFELVLLRFAGLSRHDSPQCFICVGKHAFYFVRRNLSARYPSEAGGEIYYAYLEQVIEDTESTSGVLFLVRQGLPDWQSERLFVESEHRRRLLGYLGVAWRTDYIWRFGSAKVMPLTSKPLRKKPPEEFLQVKPFRGCELVAHEEYSFFVRKSFTTQVRAVSGDVHQSTASFTDERRHLLLHIGVHDQVPLQDLEADGRDHIRWVANEHKQSATGDLKHAIFLRDAFYLKRMNLANDIACWTGWELLFRSDDMTVATILLRRQCVPPLMDCAQDMSVTVTCSGLDEAENQNEWDLLQEARLVADSATPLVLNCTSFQTLYREMIQAKLDALLFGEDTMRWLKSSVGLRPRQELELAVVFKAVLKLLQDENALNSPDLMNVLSAAVGSDSIPQAESVMKALSNLTDRAPGLLADEDATALNAWRARVARYVADGIDGGLLGAQLTLYDLVSIDVLSDEGERMMSRLIHFLLHIRPKDMSKPFADTTILELLSDGLDELTFNSRVMQSLLEFGWVAKFLARMGPAAKADAKATKAKAITVNYAHCLVRLLRADVSSASLKAAVCRELIVAKDAHVHFATFLPALVETLRSTSIYIKTYATATLVNMCSGHDVAKNALMMLGVVPLCAENLRLKADDLVQYTLALLTNMSKADHHRSTIMECGIPEVLMEQLFYLHPDDSRPQTLAELASVIGQLCNDEEIWKLMCAPRWHAAERLLGIFRAAQPGSKLRSKAMFALKQFSANPGATEIKRLVAREVLPQVVEDLEAMASASVKLDPDCAANAILLLLALSKSQEASRDMRQRGLEDLVTRLLSTQMGQLDSTRERLHQLLARMQSVQGEKSYWSAKRSGHNF
mmetsp:Transcript_123446/g.348792  ORF Transcript_123446/g.348792 Transcript_123446/m.348792 type:complete len:871 (-) Transcript_123446:279-2891(-)|eukprot:CAMPEP_0117472870 /NCGR_PEP_ID=MMETSP0784-20121206/8473_1 /TAXON_ID=39447 /ORGANISM="" /LENGTH=870 /DNA_ID=CAMNT_0005267041 /DNA_START=196 /DNA_END=2808 /DNA_ORIENTATION=+